MTSLKNKVLISWSTGKDSAYALYELKLKSEFEIAGLFTVLTKPFNRTCMHGVRLKLLAEQAKRLHLPLQIIEIPYPCSNEVYESIIGEFLTRQVENNKISHIVFGDIFLESIRNYRESKLSATSIKPLFPLWHEDTKTLAHKIIDAGFKAIVTCIDSKKLETSFVGRLFDEDFLNDLPHGVDSCGENGEFHTFVFDAPLFNKPINISQGKIEKHNGFIFVDLSFRQGI